MPGIIKCPGEVAARTSLRQRASCWKANCCASAPPQDTPRTSTSSWPSWSSDYGYYLQLIAAFGWSSLPWLRFLAQPTLVMVGTDDPIVPVANGHILAKLIPDARLVTIDDGHLFLVTSAARSAELVTEFLG